MGQKVSNFVRDVGVTILKTAAKGATSAIGAMVPVVGTPIANYINSKYAKGTDNLQPVLHPTVAAKLPEGFKEKVINTPAQLQDLVKKFPEQAAKAGLSTEMIKEEVQQIKEQAKAIGGFVSFTKPRKPIQLLKKDQIVKDEAVKPKFAKGGKVRSAAQIEATRKLVEANRKRRAKK